MGMKTSFGIICEEVPDRTPRPGFGSRPKNWDFEEWTKSDNGINPVPAWSKCHRRKMGRTKDTSRYEETMWKLYKIQWTFECWTSRAFKCLTFVWYSDQKKIINGSVVQWGSDIQPFEIQKHLKSGLFERWISNGPVDWLWWLRGLEHVSNSSRHSILKVRNSSVTHML